MDVYMWMYVYNYITHTCLERRVSCHERKCSVSADVDFPWFSNVSFARPNPTTIWFVWSETASWHFSQWNCWNLQIAELEQELNEHSLVIKAVKACAVHQDKPKSILPSMIFYIYIHTYVCFYKWHFQRVHSIGQDLPQCWRSVKVSDLMDLWNTSDSLSKHFALGAGLW